MPICTKSCNTCTELNCLWRGYSVEWRYRENEADRDIAEGRVSGPFTIDELLVELRKED